METTDAANQILVEEFRKLLVEMAERKSHNLIRFRKAGEPWHTHFLQVYDAGRGGVFYDHQDKEFVYVSDLSEISQVQFTKPAGSLEAEKIYEVMLVRFF